jgi:tetratricopeptide (TPR) repeat protein
MRLKWLSPVLIFGILLLLPTGKAEAQNDSIAWNMQNFDYVRALELIGNQQAKDSDLVLVNYTATALRGLNKHQQAIPYLEKLLKADSTNIRNLVELALCHQVTGNNTLSREYFSKALEFKPKNSYLIQQTATAFFQENNFRKALELYFLAYTSDSTTFLQRQIAKSYDNLGVIDSAMLFYAKTIMGNPSDFSSTYRLATLLMQIGAIDESLAVGDNYLSIDSTNIRMLRLSGQLHFTLENYEKSIARFNRCLELKDTSLVTTKYLGYNYYKTEKYAEAARYLEPAFKLDSLNSELCFLLGISHSRSYYPFKGIQFLDKTIDLITPRPEFLSTIYQNIGKTYAAHNRPDKAIDAYLSAIQHSPSDTLVYFKLARQYDRMRRIEQAISYYQDFLKYRGNRPPNQEPRAEDEGLKVSYYDFAERRVAELKEQLFWDDKGNKKQ